MNNEYSDGKESYRNQLLKMSANLKPGRCYITELFHDSWCGILHGTGECNCDPTVKITEMDNVADGNGGYEHEARQQHLTSGVEI